jgi:hypothetical protein
MLQICSSRSTNFMNILSGSFSLLYGPSYIWLWKKKQAFYVWHDKKYYREQQNERKKSRRNNRKDHDASCFKRWFRKIIQFFRSHTSRNTNPKWIWNRWGMKFCSRTLNPFMQWIFFTSFIISILSYLYIFVVFMLISHDWLMKFGSCLNWLIVVLEYQVITILHAFLFQSRLSTDFLISRHAKKLANIRLWLRWYRETFLLYKFFPYFRDAIY